MTGNQMSRSSKKGPHVDKKVYEKVMRLKGSGSTFPIKTWARACTIVPEFIGQRFEVHNGKMFHPVYVTEDMVGHKLGEFSPTRLFRGHSGKKKEAAK
jgi:small subunit ribosomal protein S19